ncbi:hypothetical protein E2C01_081897 [Portunus trituberculatus]|uniref:Uncharacterized protein n=1 Tax=Portunus trituberculatus TaxID=210409 RepID=A0A5B7IXP3_PORTR|nr:hypothetical protein [Portunus trituberculatus]
MVLKGLISYHYQHHISTTTISSYPSFLIPITTTTTVTLYSSVPPLPSFSRHDNHLDSHCEASTLQGLAGCSLARRVNPRG